jgi:hypothetical protein
VPDRAAQLAPGYRIELFAEQAAVSDQDVIDAWEREGVVDPGTASRRVHEVLFVGLDEHDELAGVSSAYLQRDLRLGMDLWYYRAYTVREHRMANLALVMGLRSLEHLEARYTEGIDTRASGVMYVIENATLRTYTPAWWTVVIDLAFIGEDAQGNHLRVHYFPGAPAPGPPE